ncbi:MAG: sugar phosphate nucleotidyltransferase [bacterium]|nr:sugar phosphate nucleotidyltransferase [bacterium]
MEINCGVLIAGGKGVRAYPATSFITKPMLEVAGKPLIQRNVEVLRDSLGLREIYIVIGYLGEQIKGCLGDGSKFGVNITYIQDNVMKGLAEGLYWVRDYVKGPFITVLGDELYIGSNHKAIRAFNWNEFSAVCALKETNLPQEIKKNYGVKIEGDRILSLIEKPTTVTNKYLGCGTYIFSPLNEEVYCPVAFYDFCGLWLWATFISHPCA